MSENLVSLISFINSIYPSVWHVSCGWSGCPYAAAQKSALACQVALVDSAKKVFSNVKQSELEKEPWFEKQEKKLVSFPSIEINNNPAAMVFSRFKILLRLIKMLVKDRLQYNRARQAQVPYFNVNVI